MNTCIISMGCGSWYPEGIDRLDKSLDMVKYTGDRLFWKNSLPPDSPTVQDVPYAFKPYAFMDARRKNYECVMWMDSSMWAIRDLTLLWKIIKKNGYLFIHNQWNDAGIWCSDAALETLQITREESFEYPQCSGGFIGLDMSNPLAIQFLDRWYAYANDGITFKGSHTNNNNEVSNHPRVKGHRHDQTAASILSWKMGMRNWEIPPLFQYYRPNETIIDDKALVLACGGIKSDDLETVQI